MTLLQGQRTEPSVPIDTFGLSWQRQIEDARPVLLTPDIGHSVHGPQACCCGRGLQRLQAWWLSGRLPIKTSIGGVHGWATVEARGRCYLRTSQQSYTRRQPDHGSSGRMGRAPRQCPLTVPMRTHYVVPDLVRLPHGVKLLVTVSFRCRICHPRWPKNTWSRQPEASSRPCDIHGASDLNL